MPFKARLILLSALTATACLPPSMVPVVTPVAVDSVPAPVSAPVMPAPVEDEAQATSLSESSIELSADVEAVMSAPAGPPAPAEWDIDVKSYLEHDRVDFYLKRFTGPARDRVVS